jgi:hypothetical protein
MSDQPSKNILCSKTVLGALATLGVAVLSLYGADVSMAQELQSASEEAAKDPSRLPELIFLLLTTGFTIYGRIKANQPVTLIKNNENNT